MMGPCRGAWVQADGRVCCPRGPQRRAGGITTDFLKLHLGDPLFDGK